ncbi:MAG TPA: radical SAM protein [Proteobacteria bacterium]|nr:radical SAM protein [Pseudomonadota bacterium]
MRYVGRIFRPPSEANSLLIQATIGCPHNRCAFCDMYKGIKFRARPQREIMEDLKEAADLVGPQVRSIFFPDGNTIALSTRRLVEIFEAARRLFPKLERITVYGSAKFVVRKKPEEFRALVDAGLTRIHTGLESGDAEILERMCKGADPETMVRAGRMVVDAGIELSEYVMIGLGGRRLSRRHAVESARVLNEIEPHFIRLRTTVPRPNTPLYEMWKSGEFECLKAHEAIEETKLLVENLNCNSELLSDHFTNFWNLNGRLPDEKDRMIAELDYALALDESAFRPPTEVLVHLSSL